MKRTYPIVFLLLLLLSFSQPCIAEEWADDQTLYTAVTPEGELLFKRCGAIHEGDEYISRDNILYRISSVSGSTATAQKIGEETMPDVSWLSAGDIQAVFAGSAPSCTAVSSSSSSDNKKLIAMYVTHSDESYIPTDGTQSIEGQGGIYDVARAFRDALQEQGIDVILDESTHLPHDSGAYRRSRRTAERLLQKRPDAIIDIHRDGIPDENEYTCKIEGENASQVRLLVGRGNQNSQVNREFAKQIKAVADKRYPGLIKDIFIGKGTYNQDLSPNAILLEFGTHTISKERVLNSTDVMANVINTTLYGEQTGSAKSEETAIAAKTKKDKASFSSLGVLLLIVIIAVIVFAFVQTGSLGAAGKKIGSNFREMTGGLLGRNKRKNDPESK